MKEDTASAFVVHVNDNVVEDYPLQVWEKIRIQENGTGDENIKDFCQEQFNT